MSLGTWIAPNATLIGKVMMFTHSSVSPVVVILLLTLCCPHLLVYSLGELPPLAMITVHSRLPPFSSSDKIWYGAVLRGDKSRIQIGTFTNIQERVIINTVQELASGFSPVVQIGAFVSVGHGSVLTSCVIEGNVSIGAGCIIPQGNGVQQSIDEYQNY